LKTTPARLAGDARPITEARPAGDARPITDARPAGDARIAPHTNAPAASLRSLVSIHHLSIQQLAKPARHLSSVSSKIQNFDKNVSHSIQKPYSVSFEIHFFGFFVSYSIR
jgi:hypothetical protein